MYRSLLGVYLVPAIYSAADRVSTQNIYPLILGPHGADLEGVVSALRPRVAQLDQGMKLSINGTNKTVVAFTMAFTGDMPQQEKVRLAVRLLCVSEVSISLRILQISASG